MVDELCREIGDARGVRLTATDRISVPIALGLLRPEICLPHRSLGNLSAAEQRSLLAHELAHLVRRDPAWHLTSAVIAALCFFQPLNRLAGRRLRRLSEVLCDDWAVASTGSAASLARCLTEVAGWAIERPRFFLSPGIAGGVTELGHRIQRLVDGRCGRGAPLPRRGSLLAALAAWALVGTIAPGWTAEPTASQEGAEWPAPLPQVASGEISADPEPASTAPLPMELDASQPISRSWVSVPLLDVLQDLASIRNLDFAVEPGVGGTITAELDGAPWQMVLDQVLRISSLGINRDGMVWRIAPLEPAPAVEPASAVPALAEGGAADSDSLADREPVPKAEEPPSLEDTSEQTTEDAEPDASEPGADPARDDPPEDGSQDDPPPARKAVPVAPAAPGPEPTIASSPPPVAPAADETPIAAAEPAGDYFTSPVLEERPVPRFPKMAIRLNKWRGAVTLRVTIDETGRVIDAQPVGEEVGFGFEREAIHAVRRSTYTPAQRGGEPVAAEVTVTIRFQRRR